MWTLISYSKNKKTEEIILQLTDGLLKLYLFKENIMKIKSLAVLAAFILSQVVVAVENSNIERVIRYK